MICVASVSEPPKLKVTAIPVFFVNAGPGGAERFGQRGRGEHGDAPGFGPQRPARRGRKAATRSEPRRGSIAWNARFPPGERLLPLALMNIAPNPGAGSRNSASALEPEAVGVLSREVAWLIPRGVPIIDGPPRQLRLVFEPDRVDDDFLDALAGDRHAVVLQSARSVLARARARRRRPVRSSSLYAPNDRSGSRPVEHLRHDALHRENRTFEVAEDRRQGLVGVHDAWTSGRAR